MRSKSIKSSENLLEELQTALSHGTVARRVETLRRVTDLFVGNAVDYSDDHIRLFDDVFQCLVEQIETSARALLADRLAPIASAPRKSSARSRSTRSSRSPGPCCRNRNGWTRRP